MYLGTKVSDASDANHKEVIKHPIHCKSTFRRKMFKIEYPSGSAKTQAPTGSKQVPKEAEISAKEYLPNLIYIFITLYLYFI